MEEPSGGVEPIVAGESIGPGSARGTDLGRIRPSTALARSGENAIDELTVSSDAAVGAALARLFEAATQTDPPSMAALVDVVCEVVGARSGRVLVADYGLRRFQQIDSDGLVGDLQPIEGSMAGRAFATGEIVVAEDEHAVAWVPLTDGTERLGILELTFDDWSGAIPAVLAPIAKALVLIFVSKRRYTDAWHRARRAEPLSGAAEVQWDLLPPLSCSAHEVAVSGVLEPAYFIGGDSFDYAINQRRLDFVIIDAIGHGMPAVLMASAVINGIRNERREGGSPEDCFREADRLVAERFGDSYYVTGQIGSLDLPTGVLTWLNAGHVLPMLVRNGSFVGELACPPSMPIGLGGPIAHIATETLQRGDRVLFYTDGITESQSPDGEFFGPERLADFLVRASLDQVSVAETARRLSANVSAYVGAGLKDDATLFLIEYLGHDPEQQTGVH